MKKIALGLALGFSVMASSAYAAATITAVSDGFVFGDPTAGSTFSDSYSFSVVGTQSLVATLSGNSSKVFTFSEFSLWDSTMTEVGTTSIFNSGKFGFGTLEAITTGTYTLKVAGSYTGVSSGYNGQITLTPVPEPETNALLLAGIGMLGLIARRKFS